MNLSGYAILIVETKDGHTKILGSPAESADLEAGDEIIEVNGNTLEGATHAEIIMHIHQGTTNQLLTGCVYLSIIHIDKFLTYHDIVVPVCIKSRTIQLRVKRNSGENLVPKLSSIQDAYVIAVEENARRRLENLSAQRQVEPIDITKVGRDLNWGLRNNNPEPERTDNNFTPTKSVNCVYRKIKESVADAQNPQLNDDVIKEDSLRHINHLIDSSPRHYRGSEHGSEHGSTAHAAHSDEEGSPTDCDLITSCSSDSVNSDSENGDYINEQCVDDVERICHSDTREVISDTTDNHLTDTSGNSESSQNSEPMVAKARSTDQELNTYNSNQDTGQCIMATSAMDSPAQVNSPDHHDDSMVQNPAVNGYLNGGGLQQTESPMPGEVDPRFHFSAKDTPMAQYRSSLYGNAAMSPSVGPNNNHGYQRSHDSNDAGLSETDSTGGLHREMAIDVPDHFTGVRKEPPRYPPNMSSAKSSPAGTPVRKSGVSDEFTRQGTEERRLMDRSNFQNPPPPPPPLTEQEEAQHQQRIKHYQEELRKRREAENRLVREQEFLRESLRGSKKLQALEEQKQRENELNRLAPVGIVNPNYLPEDEDIEDGDVFVKNNSSSHSKASTLPLRTRDPFDGVTIKRPVSIDDILASVRSVQTRLRSPEDQKDVAFLAHLFTASKFQQALDIHNTVLRVAMKADPGLAVNDCALDLCHEVLTALGAPLTGTEDMEELRRLLQQGNMQGMLLAHDQVSRQKSDPPKTTTAEDERDYLFERASIYGEDSIKIVRLQKTADPLGATVKNEGDSVVIGRIVKGGAADKSGLLREGDEILEINGIDMRGKNVNDVCELMANMTGTLTFLIVPSQDFTLVNQQTARETTLMHIKAHFDYDPEDDIYIPCRELGISFQKGDILHIIGQDDTLWWQAYREGEDDQALAGLIPSQNFQEQRESMKQTIVSDNKENQRGKKKKSKYNCAKKGKRKTKTKQLYNANSDDADATEILTYEEVSLYYPQPNRKRPIVLIGPPNVGRHELRQMLMESNLDRFAAAIPHTSRRRQDTEVEDKDYHFVTRQEFEEDINALRFVEYGEYEKNLYGTSVDSIGRTVTMGKICILNLYPQSLRILKSSDLKPYVVFIAPPNLEKLKQIRQKQGAKVTDLELKDMIEKAREMEDSYGHYFDLIIVNTDLNKAYEELLAEINRLEIEPQWVPATWVNKTTDGHVYHS